MKPTTMMTRRTMFATDEPLAATGGIASWCMMLHHLPAHLKLELTRLLKGLELPWPKEA